MLLQIFGHYGRKKEPLDRKSISYQQIIGLEHENNFQCALALNYARMNAAFYGFNIL